MYAIVKIGGSQYKVAQGQKLTVSRLRGDVGGDIAFPALLVADGTDVTVGNEAGKVEVGAKILSHDKGDKIHVRRYRHKSRHRRHVGVRLLTSTITIEAIGAQKAEKKPQAKSAVASKTVRKATTQTKK